MMTANCVRSRACAVSGYTLKFNNTTKATQLAKAMQRYLRSILIKQRWALCAWALEQDRQYAVAYECSLQRWQTNGATRQAGLLSMPAVSVVIAYDVVFAKVSARL